jgi:hypothetical protein
MFRHKYTTFGENRIQVLKTSCCWKTVIDEVLQSVAVLTYFFSQNGEKNKTGL